MLNSHAQKMFENLIPNLELNFQVREAIQRGDNGNSGELWGGNGRENWYALVKDGVVVEQELVSVDPEPCPWHVSGDFLRSIYKEG